MAERSPSNPWLLAERQNLSQGVTSWIARDDMQSGHFGPRIDRPLYQFRVLLAAFPPYDCYRRTVYPMRPVSSVYSDAFELEEVARQLLGSAYDDHAEAIRALESKRDALQHQRNIVRSSWATVYQLLEKTADAAASLSRSLRDAQRFMTSERNKWLANCTAI
ncbi:uncharacterized protein F5Z01DRAFT_468031 [Emericellopsis atlantica]|uniref:Uncharacterized protein n=1 Tax=Emericellopsis atlantica TaxID=2614577 RepID=A0A9P8CLJ6_9HYPO|nr:uncharacterized protein F5Z01DRAFT_468031 [Emericellopsis atlantica]KAG9249676.1 hypothetical protein F5Z01DRAFT_468031 [Emericellopsis atlantica]